MESLARCRAFMVLNPIPGLHLSRGREFGDPARIGDQNIDR